jgi:hypothetical protein
LFFLGYLLNYIPARISYKNSQSKKKTITNELKELEPKSIKYIYNKPYDKYLSTKDIIKFLVICLILILIEFNEVYLDIHDENEDKYILFQFLLVFLLPKYFSEVYYRHQNISIIFFIAVEIIQNIFIIINNKSYNKPNFAIMTILKIINSFLYAIYYLYIKDFMIYKYISPYKFNFMIGIINFPLLTIIMFIISFTPLGQKKDDKFVCDNIFELFKDIVNLNAIYIILLILLAVIYGSLVILLNKTIYDFTVYHTFIPFLVVKFIKDINQFKGKGINILVFLILSFSIELIMILVFLEIIEINFCGLNENLKRNIESRGIIDLSLINDDDNDRTNSINI